MNQISESTSKFTQEPTYDNYTLAFAPELHNFLRNGTKTSTYRFGTKYDYIKVGDTVFIPDIGTAKITEKYFRLFKDIPISIDEHETYRDKEHQRSVFNGYYAYLHREVIESDPFLVFHFKLVQLV